MKTMLETSHFLIATISTTFLHIFSFVSMRPVPTCPGKSWSPPSTSPASRNAFFLVPLRCSLFCDTIKESISQDKQKEWRMRKSWRLPQQQWVGNGLDNKSLWVHENKRLFLAMGMKRLWKESKNGRKPSPPAAFLLPYFCSPSVYTTQLHWRGYLHLLPYN